jgi:hypothetical protein
MSAFAWMLVAGIAMVGGLVLATWWLEQHPSACDAACRAARVRHWQQMSH